MYLEEEEEMFTRPITDDMDIYSDQVIDMMIDNGEISPEEAAFMTGYIEAA